MLKATTSPAQLGLLMQFKTDGTVLLTVSNLILPMDNQTQWKLR